MRSLTPLLMLLALPAAEALACSCRPPPDAASARDGAVAVYEATAEEGPETVGAEPDSPLARAGGGTVQWTFAVHRGWKGPAQEQITVQTRGSSAACGRSFAEGTTYLLFLGQSDDGTWTDNLCSRSSSQDAATDKGDYEALGAPTFPKATLGGTNKALASGLKGSAGGDAPPPTPTQREESPEVGGSAEGDDSAQGANGAGGADAAQAAGDAGSDADVEVPSEPSPDEAAPGAQDAEPVSAASATDKPSPSPASSEPADESPGCSMGGAGASWLLLPLLALASRRR